MGTPLATPDELAALFDTPPDGRRRDRLEQLLTVASDELRDELGGIDFARTPSIADGGTTIWTIDADGGRMIHVHDGIVSLTSVEYSNDYGETFETPAVTAGHYALSWDGMTRHTPPDGEPYFHLLLNPWATALGAWPRGRGVIRLTGVRGWPRVPSPAVEAVVERARQIAFADPSYAGVIAAEDAPLLPMGRWPDAFYRLAQRERSRFHACYI